MSDDFASELYSDRGAKLKLLTNPFIQDVADYDTTESYVADTQDHEDHTFCGVMFNIEIHELLPLEFVSINALCVRGELGPMTVWVTNGEFLKKYNVEREWTKVYEKSHHPSIDTLEPLILANPIRIRPGDTIGVYIHSARPSDQSVVYDNQRYATTHSNSFLTVTPGLAHLNCKPFANTAPWGNIGWRDSREFVGRVVYGVRYKLWAPLRERHITYPRVFQNIVKKLVLSHQRAVILDDYTDVLVKDFDDHEVISCLPDNLVTQLKVWQERKKSTLLLHLQFDCLMHVFNFCRWDWFPGAEEEFENPQSDSYDEDEDEEDYDDIAEPKWWKMFFRKP